MSTMKKGVFLAKPAAFWRGLSLSGRLGLGAFILVLVVGTTYVLQNTGASAVAETPNFRAVQVASVTDLQNDTTPLPLIGEVQSVNEADIRSQSGGSITRLNYKLGDYVSAGAAIAEINNASERAALLQAQGALESAEAGINKSGQLFGQSKISAVDTIKAAYSSNDDIIHSKLDTVFSNPSSVSPRFVLSVTDQSLLNKVQSDRLVLEGLLRNESIRSDMLTENSDLRAEIATAIKETRQIKAFADDVSALLNISISSQAYSDAAIASFIVTASAARTAVSGTLTALTTAQQALISSQNTGDTPDAASSAAGTLKQAQAAVNAAQANLDKTIVRAPISGTLNNLSIKLGDFVAAFQQVAIVSNNGALEIIAYITPQDRARIDSGAKVKIESEYDGWVSSIAPAVDPTTKKIEMKVGFNGTSAGLTNGESVHLEIARNTQKGATKAQALALPISAVKIGSETSVVFTVGEDNKLVAHEIQTGELIGDKIQVVSGVTEDMMLVTDARGLKAGQEVVLR